MSFEKLTWGVKASFRNYVEAAGGKITVSDGATRTDDGSFELNALPGGDLSIDADGSASGSMRFEGTIAFEAHGGMLNSTLSEIALEVIDGDLVITVLEAPMNQGRCAVAKLGGAETDGDAIVLKSEITMDGMYQIADNYPPGTELDSVQLD